MFVKNTMGERKMVHKVKFFAVFGGRGYSHLRPVERGLRFSTLYIMQTNFNIIPTF